MVLENFLIDVDVLWDRAGKELYEKPEARAGRKMRVRVTNKGLVEDLTGYTLNLGWKSTIDETKFGLDAFTAVDITKGIFELAYTSGMLTNIGTLVATLQLVPSEGAPTESNNFTITVKKSAVDAAAIQSENSFTALETALVEVTGWNARIDYVEQDFIDRANNLDATYPIELNSVKQQLAETATKAELSKVASPLTATLASQMTDTTRIYVYLGAEVGYTTGNWYYHNGAAWVSGGVYQATGLANDSVTPLIASFTDVISVDGWISDTNDLSGVTWGAAAYMRLPDGTLVTSGYTLEYRASDFVNVIENCEYRVEVAGATVYAVFFTDAKNDGVSVNLGWVSSAVGFVNFTVPAGKTKVSFNVTSTSALKTATALYRMTQLDSEKYFKMPMFVPDKALQDKVIVNFGDSIFGQARPPFDVSTALANLTGATVYNGGFGGCKMGVHSQTIYDAFSMYRLAYAIANNDWTLQDAAIVDVSLPTYFAETLAMLKTLDFDAVNIATIAYGTNDFADGLQPVSATSGEFKAVGTALSYSIETLLNAFPHLRIFICLPTYRAWLDGSNIFVEDSDTKIVTAWPSGPEQNHTLVDFVNAEKAVAIKYKLPFIDNYNELGINKFNRLQYFPVSDGTHHSQNGRDLIALHMAKKMW